MSHIRSLVQWCCRSPHHLLRRRAEAASKERSSSSNVLRRRSTSLERRAAWVTLQRASWSGALQIFWAPLLRLRLFSSSTFSLLFRCAVDVFHVLIPLMLHCSLSSLFFFAFSSFFFSLKKSCGSR